MNKNAHKIDFQLERMANIIDGIFGFSATLLVNVLINDVTEINIKNIFFSGDLFGFVISFCIIGYYWTVHHRIFQYVENYTNTLIWLNFAYAFTIILFPFTSDFFGKFILGNNIYLRNISYLIYVGNICLTAIVNAILWGYVTHPKRNILTYKISKERIQLGYLYTMIVPVIFLISAILFITINYTLGLIIIVTIPFIFRYRLNNLLKTAAEREA